MIRCSCGNELVSVEAICELCDVPVIRTMSHRCPMCGERCGCLNADGPGVECEHRCLPYAAKARMEEPITVLDEVAAECRRQDKWRAIAECLKCGEPVEQPRTGRSTSECLCCGAIYGMDFFRVHKEKR